MLTGPELTLDPDWFVVEGDLHDITHRVREYDQSALLVRESGTGQLGIAHFNKHTELVPGGTHMLAARCLDPATREPLTGEPDGRVLSYQRIADGHRISNLTVWARRRRDAMARERLAEREARREWSRAQAGEYVWRHNRVDLGRKPFATFPKEIT